MNTTTLAKAAYASSSAPIRTNQNTEYEVFSRITRRLKNTDPRTDYAGFVEALHENRKLWTLLAVDVADNNNNLPQALRAQIFYLAEFTLQHTSKVLTDTSKVDMLIEINGTIMRGLNAQGAPK